MVKQICWWLGLSALLAAFGCGTSSISAASYHQECTTAADCVVVDEGSCGQCGFPCKDSAINVSDQAAYQRDFSALDCKADNHIECSKCIFDTDRGLVPSETATCASGRCQVVR